ncbi:MAG: T9SS type A sorting domain-containing protein [Bacteroidetes Order II. Incertae sedis bacterium]|nr:T9SS type A sorting domain-containing protein [Bacteroidetes Order II. bacterium]
MYLATFYNFGNSPTSIGRNNNWAINGNMTLNGTNVSTSPNPLTVSFGNGSYLYINGAGVNFQQATFTSQNGGTWKGITMNPGSSATFDGSKILNVGGSWGGTALSVNSASLTFNNSEIDVPSGGAVYGLYASQYGGSNSVSISHSKIKSASESAIVTYGLPVSLWYSQVVQTNGKTAFRNSATTSYLGNDKIKGGKLSAGYNGGILGGLYAGHGSHNHFCDAASSSLEVSGGGYIFANSNYWNNTPTMSGSPIYYDGSLGAPNCADVSTALARARETAVQAQGIDTNANTSLSTSANADQLPDVSLLSALSKVGKGKIEEALADLQVVVHSGKMPDAQIALTQIGQLSARYQKGQEQRGFVIQKLKKSDPLYVTALETSALLDASEGKTADAINTLKTLANADKGIAGFYAQLNMAQLYHQMGDINKAKATLASAKPQSQYQEQDLAMLLATLGETKVPNNRKDMRLDDRERVTYSNTSQAVHITTYPNPFNPSTTLSYSLPQEANVRLTMYDVTGREVSVLVNQKQSQGMHQVMWQASSFASGVYFYKLVIGDQILSGKLMLVK